MSDNNMQPLTPAEIEGLPEELLAQLALTSSDRFDFDIINMISDAGGVLSLDRILIGLYRKSGKVYKRTTINARLYRMERRGMIKATSKKGVYALPPSDAAKTDQRGEPNNV